MTKYEVRAGATKTVDFVGTFEEIKDYYNINNAIVFIDEEKKEYYNFNEISWSDEEKKLVEEYENETDVYELIEIINKFYDGCYTVAEY